MYTLIFQAEEKKLLKKKFPQYFFIHYSSQKNSCDNISLLLSSKESGKMFEKETDEE